MVAHGAVVEERKFGMKGHANIAGMAWFVTRRQLGGPGGPGDRLADRQFDRPALH